MDYYIPTVINYRGLKYCTPHMSGSIERSGVHLAARGVQCAVHTVDSGILCLESGMQLLESGMQLLATNTQGAEEEWAQPSHLLQSWSRALCDTSATNSWRQGKVETLESQLLCCLGRH